MAELKVKVPIKFSERAQKALYETCMAYKELAEVRGAENAKLRELVDELYPLADYGAVDDSELDKAHDLMRELGIEVRDDS